MTDTPGQLPAETPAQPLPDPEYQSDTIRYLTGAMDGYTGEWLWRIWACLICGAAIADPEQHDTFAHPLRIDPFA